MDWMTFLASVISSLAWPAVVLVIVVLLRKPLAGLIPLLQRLKYKDLELEFGERLEVLEAELLEELPAPQDAIGPPQSRVLELATVSPRAAVLESWRGVEQATQELAKRHQIALPREKARNPFQVIRALERAEVIDSSTSSAIHELRSLRNEAAHAPEFAFDRESVLSYDNLARRVQWQLEQSSTGGNTPL